MTFEEKCIELDVKKILICARSTKQIVNLISLSDFAYGLTQREYNWLYITAKTAAKIFPIVLLPISAKPFFK